MPVFILCVLIKVDFIWGSLHHQIFCSVLENGFLYGHYFFVGLFNMHAHAQRHEDCSDVQFAILLSSLAFVKKQFCFAGL
jgi:hypothetical protein